MNRFKMAVIKLCLSVVLFKISEYCAYNYSSLSNCNIDKTIIIT